MNKVVTREQAEKEVTAWLDKKKVSESTREAYKDNVELMIDCVCDGTLVFNESDNTIRHNLLFPTEGEVPVTGLTYRSRLNDNILRPYMKGVANNDGDGRLAAYIAALTSQPKGVIHSLDTGDKKIGLAIAIFFL